MSVRGTPQRSALHTTTPLLATDYTPPSSAFPSPSQLLPPSRHIRSHSSGGSVSVIGQRRVSSSNYPEVLISPTHSHSNGHRARNYDSDIEKGHSSGSNSGYQRTIKPRYSMHDADSDSRGLKKPLTRFTLLRILTMLMLLSMIVTAIVFFYNYFLSTAARTQSLTLVTVLGRMTAPSFDLDWEMPITDLITFASVASWYHSMIAERANIVVYVTGEGVCAYVLSAFAGVQCYYVSRCANADHHPLPNVSCLLDHLLTEVTIGSHIALLNDDIAIDQRLIDSVHYLQSKGSDRWLGVSSRTDVTLTKLALKGYSDAQFPSRLSQEARQRGHRQHDDHSVDCLVASPSLLRELTASHRFPPYLAMAGLWPNHLLASAMLDSSVHVVDMTQTATVIHITAIGDDSVTHTNSGSDGISEHAVDYNHQLSFSAQGLGVKQKIGRTKYAPLMLEGECPDACIIADNSNALSSNMLAFTHRVNSDGYLAVLTVNTGYLPLAMNWICWAHRINFTNFILLSEDKHSAEVLSSLPDLSLTVLTRPHAPAKKAAADYGSVEFQATMTYRTEFLMDVLSSGYHFMTADMDAIWLNDPFKFVDQSADLSGQTHKKTKLSGGLIIVRASEAGILFWQQVIKCQRNNAKFLAEHALGTYEPSMYTEQYCINELYLKQPPPPAFTRTLLDPWLFPDGKFFFDELQSQHAGVVPVIIHNNWIRGASAKLERQREWGLLSTNDQYNQCLPITNPSQSVLAITTSKLGFSLMIRVLIHTDKHAVTSLLSSLNDLDWSNYTHSGASIALQLDVDRHDYDSDTTDLEQIVDYDARYKQLIQIANEYRFQHGTVAVLHSPRRKGRLSQFIDNWPSDKDWNDRTLALVLDEGVTLSSSLPSFIQHTVSHYYLRANQYDTRMIGVALDYEDAVIGETYWNRFPTRVPSMELSRLFAASTPSLYRYQSFSPYAQLMFPPSLKRFREWLTNYQIDPLSSLPPATTNARTTPCIPLVKTNEWFYPLSRHPDQVATGALRLGALGTEGADEIFEASLYEPEEVWWSWVLRFQYEHGLYSLATNFPSDHVLVKHHAGKVSRFIDDELKDKRSTIQLATNSDVSEVTGHLPPLSSLPLFEFHFQSMANSELLSTLPHLFPHYVRHQCYQLVEYEMEQRGRIQAEERKRVEDVTISRINSKKRSKDSLSDEMRAAKRKAEAMKLRLEQEQKNRQNPAIEIEGG